MEQVGIGEQYFLASDLPAGYDLDFEPLFYNLPDFLELRTGAKPLTFYVCSHQHKSAIAGIKFHVDRDLAESGGLGPFGSFDLSDNIDGPGLELAIQCIQKALIAQSVNRVRIRHYPALYSSKSKLRIGPLLTAAGFEIVQSQLNHHLVTNQSFKLHLHPMQKRKLQAMLSKAPSFKQEPLDQLPVIYRFIHSCREERGQTMSLGLDELRRMVNRFPTRYLLFAARIGSELAASSIFKPPMISLYSVSP